MLSHLIARTLTICIISAVHSWSFITYDGVIYVLGDICNGYGWTKIYIFLHEKWLINSQTNFIYQKFVHAIVAIGALTGCTKSVAHNLVDHMLPFRQKWFPVKYLEHLFIIGFLGYIKQSIVFFSYCCKNDPVTDHFNGDPSLISKWHVPKVRKSVRLGAMLSGRVAQWFHP